jgi:hypothetical protein
MSAYGWFDDSLEEDFNVGYWFDESFTFSYEEGAFQNFGNITDTQFVFSEQQDEIRKFGFSRIYYRGRPTVYHAGDTVNVPYKDNELSTIEAMGLAWAAFSSGVTPQ